MEKWFIYSWGVTPQLNGPFNSRDEAVEWAEERGFEQAGILGPIPFEPMPERDDYELKVDQQ